MGELYSPATGRVHQPSLCETGQLVGTMPQGGGAVGAVAQQSASASLMREWDADWKKVLLNQFHDILPGSCIGPVYKKAKELHDQAGRPWARGIAASAAGSIAGSGSAELVFNSLSWERDAVVKKADGSYARVKVPACGYAPAADSGLKEEAGHRLLDGTALKRAKTAGGQGRVLTTMGR